MINLPESGYTPENLKAILRHYNVTREEVAELLGVQIRAVHRWCVEPENKNHRDMPLVLWRQLCTEKKARTKRA